VGVFAGPEIVEDGLVLALDVANSKSYDSTPRGQQTYTSSGSYSWTCPSGVTSVSVVCIGGGGGGNGGGNGVGGAGGGGGGGLGYKNNISVTPGQSYTVVVGGGGAGDAWDGPPYSTNPADSGGDSYFIDATTVKGGGGGGGNGNSGAAGGSGGTYVGDGGGNGYSGGTGTSGSSGSGYLPATGGGGGSTGTYTGNATTRGTSKYITSNCTFGCLAGSGTGQGLLGDGSSGSYGRGGGANMNTFSNGTSGFTGAVRIMWGPDRSYPSTGVADQSGSTAFDDISGQGNNGTLVNGPTYSSANSGSLVFDGVDDHVSFSSASELQFLNRLPYTLEVWMYPTANPGASTWTGIFNREDSSVGSRDGYNIYLNGSASSTFYLATERFCTGTATGVGYTYNESVLLNIWHHVVATYDGTTLRLYRNGEQVNSGNTTGNITNTSKTLEIGRRGGGSYFNGRLTGQKIYNKSLTASEVKQNFVALRGRFGI